MKKLNEFKVLTFDCYGTLIDWESGIWDAFQPLISANGREDIERDAVLRAFGKAESQQEEETPAALYPDILAAVHRRLAGEFNLSSNPELDATFAASVPHWPAFADSADALRYLKSRYRLVILSNIHRQGFAASNRKLGVEFDAIYTAQDIGSFKPDHANFDYLLAHLEAQFGLRSQDVLHTAQSLFHDHVPPRSFGLANAWIDRQRLSQSGSWGATAQLDKRPDTDYLFYSMGEMARAVRQAFGE